MAQRSERSIKWSRQAKSGCMQGLINIFDFRRSINSPRFLMSPSHRNVPRTGHWYRQPKVQLLDDFRLKHEHKDDKANKMKVEKATSAKKREIENENYKPIQPGQYRKSDKEVIKLEGSRNISGINYIQTDTTCNSVCNICTDDWKQPMCLEPEQHVFLKLLGQMTNHQDLIVLLKELHSSKKKDQEMHVDIGSCCHLSTIGQTHCNSDDFSDQPHKEQSQNYLIHQELLDDVLKVFACHGPSNGQTSPREIYNFEEVRQFLKVLNSNELCRKILQDPNFHPVKYIPNHPSSVTDKQHAEQSCKTFQKSELLPEDNERSSRNEKQNYPRYANRLVLKAELPLEKSSMAEKDFQDPKRNSCKDESDSPTDHRNSHAPIYSAYRLKFDEGKVTSIFCFQELKRKLKHLVANNGKKHTMIAKDGIMHRIPSGSSASRCISEDPKSSIEQEMMGYCNQEPLTVNGRKNGSKDSKQKATKVQLKDEYNVSNITGKKYKNTAMFDHHKEKNSEIKTEGKRHLRELLCSDDNDPKFLKGSKSLKDFLAFSEYDQEDHDKGPFQPSTSMNSMLLHDTQQETNMEQPQLPGFKFNSSFADCGSTENPQDCNKDYDPPIKQIHKNILRSDIPCQKGAEKDDSEVIKDKGRNMDTPKGQGEIAMNECEAYPCLSMDSLEERYSSHPKSSAKPPSTCMMFDAIPINDSGADICTSQKPERLSPASLPPSFFSAKYKMILRQEPLKERVILEACLTNLNLCVNNDKFKYEYLTSLLDASGLCESNMVDKLQFSTQLLDSSLYDEVETPLEEIPDDLKLFFDCVNEALVVVYKQSSTCMPWVSHFIPNLRPFPSGEFLIQEVWRGLNHIFVLQSPTLDQIVYRELEARDWNDFRDDAQYIGHEIEVSLLEQLLREAVFELLCHP